MLQTQRERADGKASDRTDRRGDRSREEIVEARRAGYGCRVADPGEPTWMIRPFFYFGAAALGALGALYFFASRTRDQSTGRILRYSLIALVVGVVALLIARAIWPG
jgi:hypothetical protein